MRSSRCRARSCLGDGIDKCLQCQASVGEQTIAYDCGRGIGRIIRNLKQLGPLGQILSSNIGIVAKDRCTNYDDEVVSAQLLAQRSDRDRKSTPKLRVILWE